jgi:hypothetical protein
MFLGVAQPNGQASSAAHNVKTPKQSNRKFEGCARLAIPGPRSGRLAPPMSGRAAIWTRLTERDKHDLVAYLRSLPPQE